MSEDGDPAAEQPPEDEEPVDADPAGSGGGEPVGDGHEAAAEPGAEGAADHPELPVDRAVVEAASEHDEALAEEVAALYEAAADLDDRVRQLEDGLADREQEVEDLTERLKRKQADFENYKKRRKREEEKIRDRATEDLVERLLDVRDNLRRAVEEDHDDVEGLREGVKMTLGEFDRVLDAENVAAIEPSPGDEVDPQRHEVMMRVESDQPDGAVADVYEPGYEMADKVLRPAKVAVSDDD
jgi:molecular chaperone GrpE